MPSSPEAVARRPAGRRLHIGLVVCSVDWHARVLMRAFASLRVAATPIRLTECGFATSSPGGLAIDGFGADLPDAIVVRDMAGGTFEAVTLRLGILHAAREAGVLVWNDARAIAATIRPRETSRRKSRKPSRSTPTKRCR